MAEITYLRINGVPMPTPDGPCEFDEYDLDTADTGRPESGVMQRERKRAKLQRHNFTWSKLTAEEAWKLRTALMPEEVTMTFYMFDRYVSKQVNPGDLHWSQWFADGSEAHIKLTTQLSEV